MPYTEIKKFLHEVEDGNWMLFGSFSRATRNGCCLVHFQEHKEIHRMLTMETNLEKNT